MIVQAPATEPATEFQLQPGEQQVVIRMYGQGLGDCFLLAFPRATGQPVQPGQSPRPVYVLIDCGVVGGTPDGPKTMSTIVQDIRATTGGHIDLLILTHEHWDHLSSFVQAESDWDTITVDTIWMAWTEREGPDGLSEPLKTVLEKQQRALAQIADQAKRFGLREQQSTVTSLMAFLTDAADGTSFAAAPGVHDAFIAAKAKVKVDEKRVCCEPGQVRLVPGTGVAAYVLGPPRSDRILQVNPKRKGGKPVETYDDEKRIAAASSDGVRDRAGEQARRTGTAMADAIFSFERMANGASPFNAYAMPLLAASPPLEEDDDGAGETTSTLKLAQEQDLFDRSFPFDRTSRIPFHIAELDVAANPQAYPALASYFDTTNQWRRVDFDWLADADTFALRADSLTNNTSLVLAFELPSAAGADPSDRKVLLFPGDAQVGNWLSWDEIPEWTVVDHAGPSQQKPDIGDLLNRTAFYKVSHHGSHNGTLKAGGVERMPVDGKLVAFVPVSIPVAHEVKRWDNMPLEVMLNALKDHTSGRVVLPNGQVWPATIANPGVMLGPTDEPAFRVSSSKLPAKVRGRRDELLEQEVPLWIEVAINYAIDD